MRQISQPAMHHLFQAREWAPAAEAAAAGWGPWRRSWSAGKISKPANGDQEGAGRHHKGGEVGMSGRLSPRYVIVLAVSGKLHGKASTKAQR